MTKLLNIFPTILQNTFHFYIFYLAKANNSTFYFFYVKERTCEMAWIQPYLWLYLQII